MSSLRIRQRKHRPNMWNQRAVLEQSRDLVQPLSGHFDNKVRRPYAELLLYFLGNACYHRHQYSSRSQDSERALLSVSSNRIEDHVDSARIILKPLCPIHNFPGAKALDELQIGVGGRRDGTQPGVASQLDSVRAHVARGPVNQNGLSEFSMRIVEEHLPRCDGSDWTRSRFN